MELLLTPEGTLRPILLEPSGEGPEVAADRLAKSFDSDWSAALFDLAASKAVAGNTLSVVFWRTVAEHFLARLCHLQELSSASDISAPTEVQSAEWILSAPPLPGGEYLSHDMLCRIWDSLAQWSVQEARRSGGLAALLESRAPRWHQVGRVCFHLAENKTDEARPFAFMATFVSGLNPQGQPRHLPLQQALALYAGEANRPALLKLLSPLQMASERIGWVKALVDSGDVYRPMAWPAERAYGLLLSVPVMEECGLAVRLPNWWAKRPRPQVSVTIGDKKPSAVGMDSLLSFDVSVALGGERLTQDEIAELLASGDRIVRLRGQWVEVDSEKLKAAISHWQTLAKSGGKGTVSFLEGMRLLAGASPDLKPEKNEVEHREWAHVEAGSALRGMLDRLRGTSSPDNETPSITGFQATLRPYQQRGVDWLHFLSQLGLGALLADDMGLGKTIQVLAFLLRSREPGDSGPALLVVPASLLGNWRSEAKKFAPSLRVCFLHPSESSREEIDKIERAPSEELRDVDLAITTYSLVARQEWLSSVEWRLVIIDEAQAIKNAGTRQSRAVRKLGARSRIALTGTPVENRLGDLWSLFDFLNPGLLGSPKIFKTFVDSMKSRRSEQFAPLRRLVAPYILRRLKTDRSIIADLPDKSEVTRSSHLSAEQIRLYQQVVEELKESLENQDGMKRRALVLQTLMRLKQVCNHPSQLTGDLQYRPADSGKFGLLSDICEELAERQERVLVFTQFREIIDPIAANLALVFGRPGLILHGDTPIARRRSIVEEYQKPGGPPFLVLSLKAGGTGLTLTAASHVIHFDRWWNPAVEDQATDRAYRIGQKRNVLVHKFVTKGTVEERIDQMIREKRKMASDILGGGSEIDLTSLPDNELLSLVQLDVRRAGADRE